MRRIRLDAKTWHAKDDVYDALLAALESFEGHGQNFNALWDSLTESAKYDLGPDPASYLNGVQPPFHIDVVNADKASAEPTTCSWTSPICLRSKRGVWGEDIHRALRYGSGCRPSASPGERGAGTLC
jgi:hypothetical protein